MATAKRPADDAVDTDADFARIAEAIQHATPSERTPRESWQNHILWVDDRPNNNKYERKAFEAIGLTFSLVLSTGNALEVLKKDKFGAIISDMGRGEGPREGYVLLDAIRENGDKTPFVIYAGSKLPEHKREAAERGAQGSTNNPQELFTLVTNALNH